jgi:hypothetical protein
MELRLDDGGPNLVLSKSTAILKSLFYSTLLLYNQARRLTMLFATLLTAASAGVVFAWPQRPGHGGPPNNGPFNGPSNGPPNHGEHGSNAPLPWSPPGPGDGTFPQIMYDSALLITYQQSARHAQL